LSQSPSLSQVPYSLVASFLLLELLSPGKGRSVRQLEFASGEPFSQIGQAPLQMQFSSRQQNMLATLKLLVLSTWIALNEQLEPTDHLVKIGGVDWLECYSNNGLRGHVNACKVDTALKLAADCP
jgi:hypothetical protein